MNRRLIAGAVVAAALCGCGRAALASASPHPTATPVPAASIAAHSIQCPSPTSKQTRQPGAPSGRCTGVTVEFGQAADAPMGWQVANGAQGDELAYATVHGSLYLDARCPGISCGNVHIDHWNVVIDMRTGMVLSSGTAGPPLT
jgi:hypothetical protein